MANERQQDDDGSRDEILAAVLSSVLEYAYAWEYRPDGSSRPIAESRPWFEFLDVDDHPDPAVVLDRVDAPGRPLGQRGHPVRASSAGSTAKATFRAIRRDGSTRWLLERWRCRPGKADGVVVVDGVVTDVSALRNAEVALAESRSLLAAVVSAVDAYVYCWDYDLEGRGTPVYESVPPTCSCGRRPPSIPRSRRGPRSCPRTGTARASAVERREAGLDGVMEWRCRGKDGVVRWLRDYVGRCGSFRDGRRRIYGIVVDVSETVTAREDAAETRAHLDAVVNTIEDYVYAWAYEPGGEVVGGWGSVPQARFLGVDDAGGGRRRPLARPRPPGRPRGLRRPHRASATLPGRRRRVPPLHPGNAWRWVYDRSHARGVRTGACWPRASSRT